MAETVDLIVTTGGLGPTADDMTAELVAAFAGREMVLDEGIDFWAQQDYPVAVRSPSLSL